MLYICWLKNRYCSKNWNAVLVASHKIARFDHCCAFGWIHSLCNLINKNYGNKLPSLNDGPCKGSSPLGFNVRTCHSGAYFVSNLSNSVSRQTSKYSEVDLVEQHKWYKEQTVNWKQCITFDWNNEVFEISFYVIFCVLIL